MKLFIHNWKKGYDILTIHFQEGFVEKKTTALAFEKGLEKAWKIKSVMRAEKNTYYYIIILLTHVSYVVKKERKNVYFSPFIPVELY